MSALYGFHQTLFLSRGHIFASHSAALGSIVVNIDDTPVHGRSLCSFCVQLPSISGGIIAVISDFQVGTLLAIQHEILGVSRVKTRMHCIEDTMAKKAKTKAQADKKSSRQTSLSKNVGAPFSEQDPKRRLGNFSGAGEHARQGSRTAGIVGQTKKRNHTDRKSDG
jgi:hypothetical protein